MQDISNTFPNSAGRVQNNGYFSSEDGLVQGLDKTGMEFVEGYERASRDAIDKEQSWIELLQTLGIVAAHPDDGWHNREEKHFGICYPAFNNGIKIGSMVALGDYEKFVVVIITKTSGVLSKRYHYKSTIH